MNGREQSPAHLLNGVERRRVFEAQRARLSAAMIQVACERGAGNVTVAHVVARAGVSRRTFYEIFEDAEQCMLAALDHALACVCERIEPVWRTEDGWRERVRGSLLVLLALFEQQPDYARALVVESLAAGPRALEVRARVLAGLVDTIDEAAAQGKRADTFDLLTAEGVIGGVLAILHKRLTEPQLDERSADLVALVNPLMSMIVLPYLGAGAARRELERALPAIADPPAGHTGQRSDPFKDAGMRLTYRTLRVLGSIAEQTGRSNRQVGRVAGVSDQGQISKLLARLERLGLIANTAGPLVLGAPNAWTLTPSGEEVMRRVQADAPDHTVKPDRHNVADKGGSR